MNFKIYDGIPKSVRTMVWTIGLLSAAEASLRARAWHRHGIGGPVAEIYQLDESGRRQLKPGATLEGSLRHVRINSLGFRGHEPQIPKPAGVIRIVALGDSTTFGMEASDDDSVWVSRVVTELRHRAGAGFDTVNAGVPGYTLADSNALLRDRIAPLEPDIIIVNQIATDIAAHSRREFGGKTQKATESCSLDRLLEEHSLLLNLLKVNSAPLTARWLSHRRRDRLDQNGVDRYAAQLKGLVTFCRKCGWRVILCTAPRSFGDANEASNQFELAASALTNNPALSLAGLNDAFDRYNAAIRDVAQRTGTPIIDLDRRVPKGGDFFADAVHLNDAGHQLVGHAVALEIRCLMEEQTVARGTP